MKKQIGIILVLSLLMSVFAGLSETVYTAGIYEGVGEGFGGDVKLTVEIDDSKIIAIEIVEHSETAGISDAAFEELPAKIIEAQSVELDAVAGATMSSNAILEAVEKALYSAKGEEAPEKAEKELNLVSVSDIEPAPGDAAVAFVKGMENTILNYDASAAQPTREEIELMLYAAIKAPSGHNMQKYHITVITDYDVQMELALTPEVRPQKGTVLFIYCTPEGETPRSVDIGISYGYLNAMAQAFGYGTHIYTQPAFMLRDTGDFAKYGVPEGYEPNQFILVGKSDTVDATSAATNYDRKPVYSFLGE
ncbi:MAG TPA: FMN-binding protein [Christensenellaceae bacterium]|nr:FMN-binding protein [Christensenellaceae bacterium]